ncbi:MAG TPA: EscR/YscR/HrcR family type III secretion system export apparatus protein [Anaeromyxobacteraceae bacterium]|nr:EscR/YscR/HrcR family type III secretion system export apparatus protein [Anaeromyxobacteraceae bacterium]
MIAAALPAAGPIGDRPAELILLIGAVSLAPVALVTLTAFLKISVVLSVLRHAIGAPQVPPNTVITGLSLLLTFAVMAPVAEGALAAARAPVDGRGIEATLAHAQRAAEPLRAFLRRHARPQDRETFLDVSRRAGGAPRLASGPGPGPDDFAVLAPAFVVSELRRAFTLGVLVFVPVLVVDLLVANVLLSLGLTQLSPTTIALPFKLLLFVGVDGWRLLAHGLALSYLG